VTDWDVTTSASPETIKKLFSDTRLFALRHETVTLVHDGKHYEVTGFRGKTGSLLDDLAHRDFTINAAAFDPLSGRILDPFAGMDDAKRKILRAVGEPGLRFEEDPLRLMRAVRISLELGFRVEKTTLEAMKAKAFLLEKVAPERIREELVRILLVKRPSRGFNMMLRSGLLDQFLPELRKGYLMRQNIYHRHTVFKHQMLCVDEVEAQEHLRLTALLHDIAKPQTRKKSDGKWRFLGHEKASADLAREIMIRLRFSRALTSRVVNLIENHMIGYTPGWSEGAIRRLIRRVGRENMDDLMEFRRADLVAHGTGHGGMELFQELAARIKRVLEDETGEGDIELAVDGNDVIRIVGIPPGPRVGTILRDLTEMVIDSPELNSRESLVSILEKKRPGP
jgi:poly(A) polymerase/tRNA nucleotidyltransferase (CCA-adding enzyme)